MIADGELKIQDLETWIELKKKLSKKEKTCSKYELTKLFTSLKQLENDNIKKCF